MLLESKKLYHPLLGAEEQAKEYAQKYPSCQKFVVSNGIRYLLFEEEKKEWMPKAYLDLLKLQDRHPYRRFFPNRIYVIDLHIVERVLALIFNRGNFVRLVKQFEDDYDIGEMVYCETLKRLKSVQRDLNRLDDDAHLKGVMRQFLTVWGGMRRVVERKGELDWKRLGEKLRSLRDDFEELNKKNLCELKDHDLEVVGDIYKTIHACDPPINYLRGPTTLSKMLHVLSPKVFLMWDGNIRKKIVGKVFADNLDDVRYDGKDNAEGYRKYTEDTRNLLLKVFGKQCSQITKLPELRGYKKSLTKLIDEFYILSVNS